MNFFPGKRVTETLKFRMIVIAVCVHLSIWFVAAFFSSLTAVNVIFDSLDEELKTQAEFVDFNSRMFIKFVESLDIQLNAEIGQQSLFVSDSIGWGGNPMVYWGMDRHLIYRTANAPDFDIPSEEGFFDEEIIQNGEKTRWRVYTRPVNDTFWLAVGADTREARQAAVQVGIKALYPMILIIPLTILGIYLGITRGLKPMAQLAVAVANRSPTSLEPVDTNGIHAELKPVVFALNGLLERLSGALENEHRFTANAAHELQTPLTAIKSEVQMRQRGVSDPETTEMLRSIGSRVDRAVHTVRQLLTLARLESHDARLPMIELDLHQVAQNTLADHAHKALERQLVIEFPEDQQWLIRGQRDSLEIMVGNLLANAFRYTPERGRVVIDCETLDGGLLFRVANDCEPMTVAQRDKLTDRFYRKPGTNSPGAGLGLSIVQRIASVHDARMSVADWQDGRGLSVTIHFS